MTNEQAPPTIEPDMRPGVVRRLSRAAVTHIQAEELVDGFGMLQSAQERVTSEGYQLTQDDAIYFGSALVAAGNAIYDNHIDANGQDLPPENVGGPGNDGAGRDKFLQAAEIFQWAVENEPTDPRGYLWLTETQWELEQDPSTTLAKLEAMLEKYPHRDHPIIRLETARHYEKLDEGESAIGAYAKAIALSVGNVPSRQKVAARVADYLDQHQRKGTLNADELQTITSACIRAMILDPDERLYHALRAITQNLNSKLSPNT